MKSDAFLTWLDRFSGPLLAVVGLMLIALGAIVRSHEVVASIFAFAGVATVILGVLLPRLEGQFEISPTRLVATFKAARQVGAREDLTFEDRANEIFKLLNIEGESEPDTKAARQQPQTEESNQSAPVAGAPLPKPLEFVVPGDLGSISAVAQAFERHVERLFDQEGWEIESYGFTRDFVFDFKARKAEERAILSVLLRRRISAADIAAISAMFSRIDPESESRHILAINQGAFSTAARQALNAQVEFELLEIPMEGW